MMPYRNDPLAEDLKSQQNITTYGSEVYGKRRPFLEPTFSDFSLSRSSYQTSLREHQEKKSSGDNAGCFAAVACGVLGLILGGAGSFIGGLIFAFLGALLGGVIVSEINDSKRPSVSWINANKYDRAQAEYKKAIEVRDHVLQERKATEKRKIEYERKQKLRLQQQKNKDYWLSLTPFEFEEEVALRLKQSGKVDSARVTKKSGDGGVDIWAEKDKQSIIIQCKAHTAPIGIRDARELLGVKTETGVPRAILVSRSTFTRSVHDFSQANGIELIDLHELVHLAGNLEPLIDSKSISIIKTEVSEKPIDPFLEKLLLGNPAGVENKSDVAPILKHQSEFLDRYGFDSTKWKVGYAQRIIGILNDRVNQGLASPSQVRLLLKNGYSHAYEMSLADAKTEIATIAAKWSRSTRYKSKGVKL